MVRMTAHPTQLSREDVFDHTLHRLSCSASRLVEARVLWLLQPLEQTLPFRAVVLACSGRRQYEDGPLSLPLDKPRLLIRLTVHET
jgi:hypothetical protein